MEPGQHFRSVALAADGYDVGMAILGSDGQPFGWIENAGSPSEKYCKLTMRSLIDGGGEATAAMDLIQAEKNGSALWEIPGYYVRLNVYKDSDKKGKTDLTGCGRINQDAYAGKDGDGNADYTEDGDSVKGAVAALVATGIGAEVEESEAKPGDFVQRRKTTGGKYYGAGHAYQVYSVVVEGSAILGKDESPRESTGKYDEVEGYVSGITFIIDRNTDPDLVGAITNTLSMKAIDANIGRAAGDGVSVSNGHEFGEKTTSRTYYGRLTSNPWSGFVNADGRASKEQDA